MEVAPLGIVQNLVKKDYNDQSTYVKYNELIKSEIDLLQRNKEKLKIMKGARLTCQFQILPSLYDIDDQTLYS